MLKNFILLFCFSSLAISCSEDDDQVISPVNNRVSNPGSNLIVPSQYEFERNGKSTVSYSGQTSRLNQLEELTIELKKSHVGTSISAQVLQDMFANQNNPFSQTYPKDLKSKTFDLDTAYFDALLQEAAQLSGTSTQASAGVPGLLTRSNGSKILVDAGGREFVQLIEKGLMGATFFNQINNTYLTASKIGPQVNNSNPVDTANGKHYTDMEHHFDEAFGYLGFPSDFHSNYSGNQPVRFWGKYSNAADPMLGLNDKIMLAYKTGRAAIVAKNYIELDRQVVQIHNLLETLTAATAIHYLNASLSEPNTGERHHALSEAYAFVRALRYSNFLHRKMDAQSVTELWDVKIGNDYYQVSSVNLRFVKNTLSAAYGLESVKDQL